MAIDDVKRRLVFNGVLLFFLGLLAGGVVQSMASPRLGLSAHVGAAMAGTFMALVGAVWDQVRLAARGVAVVFWGVLYGSYGSSVGLFLAALFGTSRTTPIAGAGHVGTAWQENLVAFVLTTSAAVMLVACVLLLWGLRGGAQRRSGARMA
jgi:hydroxylaminobenzene mutase